MRQIFSLALVGAFIIFNYVDAAELDVHNNSKNFILVNWRENNISDYDRNVKYPQIVKDYEGLVPEALNPYRIIQTQQIAPGDKAHFGSGLKNIELLTVDEILPTGETRNITTIYPGIGKYKLHQKIDYFGPKKVLVNGGLTQTSKNIEAFFTAHPSGYKPDQQGE